MYYVYVHKRKGTDKIFYVGKGTKGKSGINRIESDKNRNRWWVHVVEKDGGFDYEIIKDNLSEEEAYKFEIQLIEELGIDNLVNIAEGGSGGDTLTNHPDFDKIGKKISKAHKGENNPNYGKGYYYWWVKKYGKKKADEMQLELHEKLSKSRSGKNHHYYGKKRPDFLGDKNPSKREDVREKIRQQKLNQTKVKCPKCGRMISESRMGIHMKGKLCLTGRR